MNDRETIEFNQTILRQHQIMISVMNTYQRSRWPWVRWVANAIREEMMYRIAIEEP